MFDQSLKKWGNSDNTVNLLLTFFTPVYTDNRESKELAEELRSTLTFPYFDNRDTRWEDGTYENDLWNYAMLLFIYRESKRGDFNCADSMYRTFMYNESAIPERVFDTDSVPAKFMRASLLLVKGLLHEGKLLDQPKESYSHDEMKQVHMTATDGWMLDPKEVYVKLTELYN